MGDLLRRLLYPLLLPAIVATVWLHAWALRGNGHPADMAPAAIAADGTLTVPSLPPPRGYGFAATDDAHAGLDFEDQ